MTVRVAEGGGLGGDGGGGGGLGGDGGGGGLGGGGGDASSPARSSPTCSPPGTLGSLKKKENLVCGLPRLVWLRSKKSFASP